MFVCFYANSEENRFQKWFLILYHTFVEAKEVFVKSSVTLRLRHLTIPTNDVFKTLFWTRCD